MSAARMSIAVAFLADIAMKIWVRSDPANAGRFAFWPSVGPIGVVPSMNDVLAFSLPIANRLIWPIGWLVVLMLIGALRRNGEWRMENGECRIAIASIILGAISNLADRTFLGGVTDYLSFTNLFPAFNIADLLIVSGIVGWAMAERNRAATASAPPT